MIRHVSRVLALAALLSGCAAQTGQSPDYVPGQGGPGYGPQGPMGRNAVPEGPAPGESSAGGSASAGTTGSQDNQQAMCELHQRFMAARTREEREALMDRYMQGMSPEMRERHRQMMWERCR